MKFIYSKYSCFFFPIRHDVKIVHGKNGLNNIINTLSSTEKNTIKTLKIGTPRLTTIVVINIKQFNFTMQ